jgi:hypothetical protein
MTFSSSDDHTLAVVSHQNVSVELNFSLNLPTQTLMLWNSLALPIMMGVLPSSIEWHLTQHNWQGLMIP